jgi:ABC transporter substrate binding protein
MGRPEVASRLEAVSGTLVCSEERPSKVDSSTCSAWACSQHAVQPPHSKKADGTPGRLARESFAQSRERLAALMSFGPDSANAGRDCAQVLAEILHGVNPADVPISQPTKCELCFNLSTAKSLGIEISPSLLVQADKVIE